MSKPVINVTIFPDGNVEIAPSGVKGKKCTDYTKFLEDALGLDTGKRKTTPDYFQSETVKQQQRT